MVRKTHPFYTLLSLHRSKLTREILDIPKETVRAELDWVLAYAADAQGFLRGWWGTSIENPLQITIIAHWSSLNAWAIDFRSQPGYPDFVSRVRALADGASRMLHFVPDHDIPDLHEWPEVEVCVCYNVKDVSYGHSLKTLLDTLDFKTVGITDAAYGFFVEEASAGVGKEQGPAAVLLIGWQSLEKHKAFQKSSAFKENIHLLKDGAESLAMVRPQALQAHPVINIPTSTTSEYRLVVWLLERMHNRRTDLADMNIDLFQGLWDCIVRIEHGSRANDFFKSCKIM